MKICYINFNLDNPRDQITLRGFKEIGVEVEEIADNSSGWKKYSNIYKKYKIHSKEYDVVMIGYAASVLVVLMRVLSQKKIIYNHK